MISDVLSEAHEGVRSYLDDPVFADVYSGELRAEIERVLAEMEALRQRLDQPPRRGATSQ
jgi:hypothetical protein